jgi:hypothetical protein
MPPAATQTVTVTAPTIATQGRTVGAGLHQSTGFQLGVSTHGGVTVTVTSSNPSILEVSPNSTTEGTGSFEVVVPNGSSSVSYYVQGVEGTTGSATVTVSATGFTDGSASTTVVTPGIVLGGLSGSTTTLSADDPFYAWIGYPSGNSVNSQAIRPGGVPVTVTFDTNDTDVGLLTDGSISGPTVTAIIPVGDDNSPTSVAAGGVAAHHAASRHADGDGDGADDRDSGPYGRRRSPPVDRLPTRCEHARWRDGEGEEFEPVDPPVGSELDDPRC